MNVLDLFSGIGGFSLGLERVGMRTVAFCERDPFCCAVLRKHWPHVPIFDDVRELDATRLGGLGRIDLVCGGFPCQPFSHAGKQRAHQDDRYLWPAMREVIALARPAWVLGENVAGIIALALDDVLADLEALRYAARPFVIPACAVDAPHRRDRVWIIARDTDRQGESTLAIDASLAELPGDVADPGCGRVQSEREPAELRGAGRANGREASARTVPAATGGGREDVADADESGLEGRHRRVLSERPDEWPSWTSGASSADAALLQRRALERHESNGALSRDGSVADPDRESVGRLAEPWSQRCQWGAEPDVGRVADGVPRRVDRLRCLGNAVVPQLVEELGRMIMIAHQHGGNAHAGKP